MSKTNRYNDRYNDRNDRRRFDRREERFEDPKPRRDYELEKVQTTLAYATRDIRDLRAAFNKLLRFALEQQWFDKELVERLGKPYLPHAPGLDGLQEEDTAAPATNDNND